jgi:DNA-binding NtrC family response regulator
MSSRIVVFGRDPVLLETRQRILEKAGFDSVAVNGISQLMSLVKREDVVLLVLCSSLSEMECEAVLFRIEELGRTDLEKLVLTKDGGITSTHGRINVIQTPTSPQTFLSLAGAAVGAPTPSPQFIK